MTSRPEVADVCETGLTETTITIFAAALSSNNLIHTGQAVKDVTIGLATPAIFPPKLTVSLSLNRPVVCAQ